MPSTKPVLYSLPIVTVGVIAFAIFVVGAPRPYLGARVFGGPTEGASALSLRVAIVERYAEVEEPADVGDFAVEVELSDGRRAAAKGSTDSRGMGSVRVTIPGAPVSGPLRLRVTQPRARARALTLADARVELGVAEWASRARELGGWLPGSRKGPLTVRVGPGRGVLAVPFAESLWVEVRDGQGPVRDARLSFDADGIERLKPERPLRTDSFGRAEARVAPREHAVALKVVATSDERSGEWYGSLPVVAGALRATLAQGKLRLESPIERDVAYWALIGRSARMAGGVVALEPDGRGGAVALVDLPALPDEPLWAVVSGEPELDSASTVGWPLRAPALDAPEAAEPPRARAVPDRRLADGLSIGFEADVARRARARWLALGFTTLAALLAALLLAREGRRAAARLDEHLRAAGASEDVADAIAPRRARWIGLGIALLCMAMGFAVVALVALYRIG